MGYWHRWGVLMVAVMLLGVAGCCTTMRKPPATAAATGAAATGRVRFEVFMAEEHPVPGWQKLALAQNPRGVHPREVYVPAKPTLTGADVAFAQVATTAEGDPAVQVRLTAAGAQAWSTLTSAHVGGPVAFVVDGRLVAAPVLASPMTGGWLIFGHVTADEAARLVAALNKH